MDFQQSIDIRGNAARVCSYFAQIENQQELHPLIYAVTQLSDSGEGTLPRIREYQIEEKIPFLGIFSMKNRYRLRSSSGNVPNELVFEAFSQPNVQLHNCIFFEQISPEMMRVTESVAITSPAILKNFVKKTAYKAHSQMLARLKEVMERETDQAR